METKKEPEITDGGKHTIIFGQGIGTTLSDLTVLMTSTYIYIYIHC